jgi:hypothetical protein
MKSCFHVLRGVALLKGIVSLAHSCRDDRFPRPSGRGSIEGYSTSDARKSSGGFPRPSGRGSIEGGYDMSTPEGRAGVSTSFGAWLY